MYVYLFLKMGVWVTNSSIIKLLLSSNLLFSNFSCASDWRDFSDDKVPESIAPFIIRKSKFPQNPKRSVRFSGKGTKRSVQKRKARNTQKAETKVL